MLLSLGGVLLCSLFSLVWLFIMTKIMGRKQMSELSMFDYIVGISIGSIAAEMATELEEWEQPFLAMTVYGVSALVISLLDSKNFKAAKIISGLPLILYEDGRIYSEALKKSKLGVLDLLSQSRLQGFFNLSQLKCIVLEPNGNISFLPLECNRPLTPLDMNKTPQQQDIPVNIVLEGKIIHKNLSDAGLNVNWLNTELEKQGIKGYKNILLATADSDNNLSVYSK